MRCVNGYYGATCNWVRKGHFVQRAFSALRHCILLHRGSIGNHTNAGGSIDGIPIGTPNCNAAFRCEEKGQIHEDIYSRKLMNKTAHSLSTYLLFRLPSNLPVRLSACLVHCLPGCLPTFFIVCLFHYLPSYLPVFSTVCLFCCLPVFSPVRLAICLFFCLPAFSLTVFFTFSLCEV